MIEIITEIITTIKSHVVWEHLVLIPDKGKTYCSSCPFAKEHLNIENIYKMGEDIDQFYYKCGWDSNECVFLGEKCYLKTHVEVK